MQRTLSNSKYISCKNLDALGIGAYVNIVTSEDLITNLESIM